MHLTSGRASALERFARDWRLLAGADHDRRALVAVSGGADSMALLLLLHALLGERCIAATVDHRLRPDSAAEAAAVHDVCAARGIEHVVLAGELPARAGRTANMPARARSLRYALLRAHAGANDARWIATAHHADDQLETMVMRLNRGSGLGGLAGVRRRDGALIRPLLAWRRAELAALVAAAGVTPVDDPSNTDERFDRARLRRQLALADWLDPVMAARSAAALDQAEEAILWLVERALSDACRFRDGEALMTLTRAPDEVRRRLVARCLRHVDPRIEPRGGDVTRLIAALDAGEVATLGQVRCAPETQAADAGTAAWAFQRAPGRRGG